eukprot:12158707-Heterocapsa_arctica.AAC.1
MIVGMGPISLDSFSLSLCASCELLLAFVAAPGLWSPGAASSPGRMCLSSPPVGCTSRPFGLSAAAATFCRGPMPGHLMPPG